MAENSKIEWTHHTFNPWIGCQKVSEGCKNCYAEKETFARVQRASGRELWGPNAERHITSDGNWAKPLKWNREAECNCGAAGTGGQECSFCANGCVRPRVFCASMADVFEDRPELIEPRRRLFGVINETPNLDWLLLTKRPENIERLFDDVRRHWGWDEDLSVMNIWLGTSVENQEQADKRIPELLKVPAAVRFLSCEPLLGDMSFQRQIRGIEWNLLTGEQREGGFRSRPGRGIDWVIVGGESGPGARPMRLEWARSLRDQCTAAGVAFHFKQYGDWVAESGIGATKLQPVNMQTMKVLDGRLAGQTFAVGYFEDQLPVLRVGKKAAGRVLDGRTWDELP